MVCLRSDHCAERGSREAFKGKGIYAASEPAMKSLLRYGIYTWRRRHSERNITFLQVHSPSDI